MSAETPTLSIVTTSEYQRGWRAYDNRLERADNPYSFNTLAAYRWHVGWDDAEDYAASYRNYA